MMKDKNSVDQITKIITDQVLMAMEQKITPIVLSAIQSCIPNILQTVIKTVTKTVEATVESATAPLKNELENVKEMVKNSEKVKEKTVQDAAAYATVVKSPKKSETVFTKPANKSVLTGNGDDIGIRRSYHIVVKKIPDSPNYDSQWLKDFLQARVPKPALVNHVVQMKSNDKERLKRSRTRTFKVVIEYTGKTEDLYNEKIFPRHAEIRRFRFMRENQRLTPAPLFETQNYNSSSTIRPLSYVSRTAIVQKLQ